MRELMFGTVFAALTAVPAVGIQAWPVAGHPVAAFFPSGTRPADALRAIGQADGRFIWQSADRATAISIGEHENYVASLYAAGAWLVIDADFAKLCFGIAKERSALDGARS